jgi:hypothetical protein
MPERLDPSTGVMEHWSIEKKAFNIQPSLHHSNTPTSPGMTKTDTPKSFEIKFFAQRLPPVKTPTWFDRGEAH